MRLAKGFVAWVGVLLLAALSMAALADDPDMLPRGQWVGDETPSLPYARKALLVEPGSNYNLTVRIRTYRTDAESDFYAQGTTAIHQVKSGEWAGTFNVAKVGESRYIPVGEPQPTAVRLLGLTLHSGDSVPFNFVISQHGSAVWTTLDEHGAPIFAHILRQYGKSTQ